MIISHMSKVISEKFHLKFCVMKLLSKGKRKFHNDSHIMKNVAKNYRSFLA